MKWLQIIGICTKYHWEVNHTCKEVTSRIPSSNFTGLLQMSHLLPNLQIHIKHRCKNLTALFTIFLRMLLEKQQTNKVQCIQSCERHLWVHLICVHTNFVRYYCKTSPWKVLTGSLHTCNSQTSDSPQNRDLSHKLQVEESQSVFYVFVTMCNCTQTDVHSAYISKYYISWNWFCLYKSHSSTSVSLQIA